MTVYFPIDSRDFNPRPREEGDWTKCDDNEYTRISIHALVKRATGSGFVGVRFWFYFNPRPREEGDSWRVPQLVGRTISIHALVKRATSNACR